MNDIFPELDWELTHLQGIQGRQGATGAQGATGSQ